MPADEGPRWSCASTIRPTAGRSPGPRLSRRTRPAIPHTRLGRALLIPEPAFHRRGPSLSHHHGQLHELIVRMHLMALTVVHVRFAATIVVPITTAGSSTIAIAIAVVVAAPAPVVVVIARVV